MQQTEGADAMQPAERHVLEEAAQKLVRGQGHALALAFGAVSIGEGDRALVAGGDGLVGESSAMDVASEVVEHDAGASDGLGEDDPRLIPGDEGQRESGHGAASEAKEATAEVIGQSAHGDEEGLLTSRRSNPGSSVGSEHPRGHEQMDVRMPLEGSGPGVEHGERADAPAEPARIGAERSRESKAERKRTPRSAC
jgi:hypothetical protein